MLIHSIIGIFISFTLIVNVSSRRNSVDLPCKEVSDFELKTNTQYQTCCVHDGDDEYFVQWERTDEALNANCYENNCMQYVSLDTVVNFWKIHYCDARKTFGKAWPTLMILLWIPFICMLFFCLASTADVFFVPTLQQLSELLELSPSVAGATLLALANGAPDFFVGIAGVLGNDQTELIIGGAVGGAMMVSVLVLGVVLISKPFFVSRRPFLRENLFLLIAFIFFGISIHLTIIPPFWYALIMIGSYIMYIICVVFGKKWKHKFPYLEHIMTETNVFTTNKFQPTKRIPVRQFSSTVSVLRRKDTFNSDLDIDTSSQNDENMTAGDIENQVDTKPQNPDTSETMAADSDEADQSDQRDQSDESDETEKPCRKTETEMTRTDSTRTTTTTATATPRSITQDARSEGGDETMMTRVSIDAITIRYFSDIVEYVKQIIEWEDQNIFGKIISILELPLTLLRIVSVPNIDEKLYNRQICSLSLGIAPLMIIFAFNKSLLYSFDIFGHMITYSICIIIILVSYLWFLPIDKAPTCKWQKGIILSMAFVACSSWIMFFANQLVGLLEVFAFVVGISEQFAGITLLAWGNSVGDLITDRSIALSGDPQGAVTACYAGPIFNILWSFAMAIFIKSAFGKTSVKWGGTHYTLSYVMLLVTLLIGFSTTIGSKFYMSKRIGVLLIAAYAVFFLVNMYGEFDGYVPVPDFMKPRVDE